MKRITTLLLSMSLAWNLATAQDTMYFYKAGKVALKQATAQVDSIIFYKVNTTQNNAITDADGNVYHAVTIGTQTWMVENLKTTKYNDGSSIPNVTNSSSWGTLTTPGYCWYDNDATTNKTIYGALYNWYAVNTGKLCPKGWHVPSDAEWKTFENYLLAHYNYDSSTTGEGKYALAIAATSNWTPDNGQGNVGNTDYPALRNVTGWSALPAGQRTSNYFDGIGSYAYWWSSSEAGLAIFHATASNYHNLYSSSNFKYYGFSVRCIKD